MFLRRNRRTVGGESYEYWTLVKTVRTARGPRQQVVATLGKEVGDEGTRAGCEDLARLLDGTPAVPFQGELGKPRGTMTPRQWIQVEMRGLRAERVLDFGQGYLALSVWRRLGLHSLLAN